MAELPDEARRRALGALDELPDEVGLLGLRAVVPTMVALQIGRQPNLLASEALAAALLLEAEILVATDAPLIRDGAAHLGLAYRVVDG
jgi:hypothetical protein